MRAASQAVIRLGLVCAIVLAAVPAQGTAVPTIGTFEADGPTDVEGLLGLLDARGAVSFELAGTVGAVYGWHYETDTWIVADGMGNEYGSVQDPQDCDPMDALALTPFASCTAVTAVGTPGAPLEHVRLAASASAPQNFLRAFTSDGGMDVALVHQVLNGSAAPGISARGGVTPEPVRALAESDAGQAEENQEASADWPFFTTRVSGQDAILAQARGNSEILHLRGDFVLEFSGITVNVADGPSTLTFETGRSQTNSAGVQTLSQDFLRLIVVDANLRLTHTEGRVACVFETARLASEGADLQVTRAQGLQGLTERDGGAVVPAPYDMGLAAGDDSMVVTDAPGAAVDAQASMVAAVGKSPLLWTVLAVLGAAAVAAYVVRATRVPPLPRVEVALQAGEYNKAVRLSTRILRAHPRQESAHLSRAIAWSRAGKHDRIVKHVEPFLRRHEPSDGTIHYVLGLAYLDMGREDKARDMMGEAIARTPSLLADVQPSLRPSHRHEGHAYT